MAADRRHVRGRGGAEVWVDIDRDMDEATFDAMVKRGDLTPIEEKKPAKTAAKSSSKK